MDVKAFKQIFPVGEKNEAFAESFVGQSYLKMRMVGASGGKCIQNAEIRGIRMKKLIVAGSLHKRGLWMLLLVN